MMNENKNKAGNDKKTLFFLLMFLLLFLVVELFGYGFFYVRYDCLPKKFGKDTFHPRTLYKTDHPYLPYIAKKSNDGFLLEIHSFGGRGKEPENPKTKIRIVTYGGSTTYDGGHKWDKTWPGYLQQILGAEKYEVINMAQNGATTADTLVNLSLLGIELKPDFVLVYDATNDLESSYSIDFKPDYSHRRRNIGKIPYPIFDRLPGWLEYSSIFVALRHLLIGHYDLATLYTRPEAKYDFKNGPFGLEIFRRNLRNINAVAQAHKAKLILGTFQFYKPFAVKLQGHEFADAWEKGINLENKIIRDLAASEPNIYLADLVKNFQVDESDMTDWVHLTALGNKKIAAVYAKAVLSAYDKGP
jgi:lysophospholipase L1-like esterase